MSDIPPKRVALVLGAALRSDGTPTPALERRVLHAVKMWQAGNVDQILMTGGVPKAGKTEAEVMRVIAMDRGVPAASILIEDQAGNTWENLLNSRPLIPEQANVVLVTDPYHAPRAMMMARRQGWNMQADCPPSSGLPLRKRLKGRLREWAATALYLVRGPRRSH